MRRGEEPGPQGFFQSLHGPWAGGASNRWRDFLGAKGPPLPPTSSHPCSSAPAGPLSLDGPPKSLSQPHTSLPVTDTHPGGDGHTHPHTDPMPGTPTHPSSHAALLSVTPTPALGHPNTRSRPTPSYSWAPSPLLQGTSTPLPPQHISYSKLCKDWHPPLGPPARVPPGVTPRPHHPPYVLTHP